VKNLVVREDGRKRRGKVRLYGAWLAVLPLFWAFEAQGELLREPFTLPTQISPHDSEIARHRRCKGEQIRELVAMALNPF
jgi:hypothetical protein